jgi:hypothetical protein
MFRLPVFLIAALLLGCGAAARPQVSVLGLAPRGQHLIVEIHNPTGHELAIEAFEWTLTSDGQPRTSGTLPIRRSLVPGGSTVVEVPASVSGTYRLDGRLRASDRASWRVSVKGRFQ